MRSTLILLLLSVSALVCAQSRQVQLSTRVSADQYRVIGGVVEDAGQVPTLELDRYKVRSGDTVETILEARGIRSSPRARALVLEANPTLRDGNRIYEGMTLVVPGLDSDYRGTGLVTLGSPDRVERARLTAQILSERSLAVERVDTKQALQEFALTLVQSTDSVAGLPARTLDAWSRHGDALDRMAAGPGGAELVTTLAANASEGLDQTMAYARSGRSTIVQISVQARDAPSGEISSSCRIRYALWGDAYKGHEVDGNRAMDFSASACTDGKESLDSWIPYGIWAEWREDDTWRRSQIKRVEVTPDIAWSIDLPLQPYE